MGKSSHSLRLNATNYIVKLIIKLKVCLSIPEQLTGILLITNKGSLYFYENRFGPSDLSMYLSMPDSQQIGKEVPLQHID